MLVHEDQDVLLRAKFELELVCRDIDDRPLLRLGHWVRLHLKLGWNYRIARLRAIRVNSRVRLIGGFLRIRYVSRYQICISDIAGELKSMSGDKTLADLAIKI